MQIMKKIINMQMMNMKVRWNKMKVMIRYLNGNKPEIKKFLTFKSIIKHLRKCGYDNIIFDFNTIKADKVRCYVFVDNEPDEEKSEVE